MRIDEAHKSIIDESFTRVSYNGYYVTFPRLRRGFDSLHPHHVVARLPFVSPAVVRFTSCPVMSACGLGTTPSTRTTLWHDLRLYAKLELFARQGVDELVPGADILERTIITQVILIWCFLCLFINWHEGCLIVVSSCVLRAS